MSAITSHTLSLNVDALAQARPIEQGWYRDYYHRLNQSRRAERYTLCPRRGSASVLTMHIAIYDLDRTLTRAPTFTPFLLFAARRLAPWRLVMTPLWLIAMLGYRAGLTNRTRLKQFGMRLMLGQPSVMRLDAVAQAFAERTATGLHPGASRQWQADGDAGVQRIIATAAFALYAAPIGQLLGADAVIGTAFAPDGSIPGGNCYGAVKLARVQQWLSGIDRTTTHIRFYSDSFADAPLLDWVDEAWLVTAHAGEARRAIARGWQVVDFSR